MKRTPENFPKMKVRGHRRRQRQQAKQVGDAFIRIEALASKFTDAMRKLGISESFMVFAESVAKARSEANR